MGLSVLVHFYLLVLTSNRFRLFLMRLQDAPYIHLGGDDRELSIFKV